MAPSESPSDRLERELRTLIPVALAVSEKDGYDRAATARRVIRVTMACARPLLPAG